MLITLCILNFLSLVPRYNTQVHDGNQNIPDFMESPLYPESLVTLAIQENIIYALMKSYSHKLKRRLALIDSFIKDYEESSLRGTEHIVANPEQRPYEKFEKGRTVANHPFMIFRMVRRFSKSLPEIMALIGSNLEQDVFREINNHKRRVPSTEEHLSNCMEIILNIQKVHDIPIVKFADGRFPDVEISSSLFTVQNAVGLNAEQCYELGNYAFRKGLIALAIEWMNVADFKLDTQHDDNGLSMDISENLEHYAAIHDDLWDMDLMAAKRTRGHKIFRNSDLYENKIVSKVELIKRDAVDFSLNQGELTMENAWINFKALCRGKNYQHERWVKPLLFCYYEHKRHPYFSLSPVKIEILSKMPLVIQVHDIFMDRTSTLKFHGHSSFTKRTYNAPRLVEYVTGLSTTVSEIKFSFNGIGFMDHRLGNDENFENQKLTDPRAAFIIHINEPLSGGEIAFPMLGFVAKPIRGSAIFWKNRLRNGDKDHRLIYGRCPVLQGSLMELQLKWDGA